MATTDTGNSLPPDLAADLQAITEHLTTGKPLDPEAARRIEERSRTAREEVLRTRGVQDISAQLIREARGPLDDSQVRELTLAQRDLLRLGQLRLTDPDTGKTYVLVPEDEYLRLRGLAR